MSKVQKSIEHVRRFHPEVVMVVFANDGRWQYMDEDFGSPTFTSNEMNTKLLEDASDETYESHGHPCVIYWDKF